MKDCQGYSVGNLGNMRFDDASTQLGMSHSMDRIYQQFTKYTIYHVLTQKLQTVTLFTYDPETGIYELGTDDFDYYPYYYSNLLYDDFEFNRLGKLFYIHGNEKVSLTDKFNYAELFQVNDAEQAIYVEMNPISTDPQSTKVLYSAMLPWNNYNYGIYCVSSLDGMLQLPLDSKMTYARPEWVKNGSLVFVSQQKDKEGAFMVDANEKPVLVVKLMNPDGTVVTVGNGNDFAVKPLY